MFSRSGAFWRYGCSEAGSILPIAALLFPVIIGMAGAGIDISNWLMSRRQLQTAADAAALAGAWELANGGSTSAVQAAALREAINNGYDPDLANSLTTTIRVNDETNGCDDDDENDDGVAEDDDGDGEEDGNCGTTSVRVDIQEKVDVWFSSVFIDKTVYAGTTATAEEVEGGPFCVLGLDQTAIGAVAAAGSVNLDSPNCGIAVNSNSGSALSLSGNANMNVGEVRVVGDYSTTGSADFSYSSLRTNAAPTADPYADLDIPPFPSCTDWHMAHDNNSYNHDTTLSPGTYCGGITITGNNAITLEPGVYIMDGGDFNVSGGGSISGTGVTIILTNSGGTSYGTYGNISMSGGKTIYLQAPTTGDYAGVAVYQDRNAPVGSGTQYINQITGTVGVEIQGVVYTPARELDFGGNGRVGAAGEPICTKLIAKEVLFQGNPAMGSDCTGSGTENIGNPSARLVL